MHANTKKPPTTNSDGLAGLRAVVDENLGSLDGLDDLDNAGIRDRDKRMALIAERVLHIVRAILIGMNRDYERCGRAACARSHRCRGFACETGRLPALAPSVADRHHAHHPEFGDRS